MEYFAAGKTPKKLEEKLKKSLKAKDCTKKLLQNCKSCDGPCTTVEELQQILEKKCDQDVHVVKTELTYYAHTHKADKLERLDLFRLNSISHEEKLTNLAILLSEDCISAYIVADLPTNDVVAVLEGTTTEQQSNEPSNLKINDLCVVVWQNCDAGYEWYIGYIKNLTADGYCVDHLHRINKDCHNKWKYPSQEGVHTAEFEQIVNCVVYGE